MHAFAVDARDGVEHVLPGRVPLPCADRPGGPVPTKDERLPGVLPHDRTCREALLRTRARDAVELALAVVRNLRGAGSARSSSPGRSSARSAPLWKTLVVAVPTAAQNVGVGQATLLSWLAPAALGLDMTCHEEPFQRSTSVVSLSKGPRLPTAKHLVVLAHATPVQQPVGDRRRRRSSSSARRRTARRAGFEPERPTAKQNVGPLHVTPKSDADAARPRLHRRPW